MPHGLLRDALPFCDMKLTLFCVSTTSGLLHDVFQDVSVHPIPIEICYGLLSDACLFVTRNLTFFWCLYLLAFYTTFFSW